MRILIGGGGEVGYLTARRLSREGNEVTIVEQNAERCAHLEEVLDARVVRGSASSPETLREAGIRDTELLIAVSDSDEVNLLACLIAQAESAATVKVASLRTHEADHWRALCGTVSLKIDLIIHSESELASRILRVLGTPGVSDIVDFAGGRVKLFGMGIDEGSWVAGKTLAELDRTGPPKNSLIAMIFRGAEVIIPHGSDVLLPGDQIYIITRSIDLEKVIEFMGLHRSARLERVFILGGKQLSIWMAQALEKRGVDVKLFERDAARCEKISQVLDSTVVVHADGTDEAALIEENIRDASAYLAFTNDDEDNIIASLLARRLGAQKVVALVNRLNYLPMAHRLGISTTVSPRLHAVDRILQFVRKGRVLSVTTFREEEAEAIELVAAAESRYVGKKLKDVRLPNGAIVGAIARAGGAVIVPRGEESIEPGDGVIFFPRKRVVHDLESAFLWSRGGGRLDPGSGPWACAGAFPARVGGHYGAPGRRRLDRLQRRPQAAPLQLDDHGRCGRPAGMAKPAAGDGAFASRRNSAGHADLDRHRRVRWPAVFFLAALQRSHRRHIRGCLGLHHHRRHSAAPG
ncbi:MAG: Trk system potassium transporter TrkA [Acidobacteriales bacterium]|nr:MAG: Trk system potassium transporter TrkA [Terriglobales bacterium]